MHYHLSGQSHHTTTISYITQLAATRSLTLDRGGTPTPNASIKVLHHPYTRAVVTRDLQYTYRLLLLIIDSSSLSLCVIPMRDASHTRLSITKFQKGKGVVGGFSLVFIKGRLHTTRHDTPITTTTAPLPRRRRWFASRFDFRFLSSRSWQPRFRLTTVPD
jgi:hypothetical protein